MEVDPTSTGDVGGSGDATQEQPPLLNPPIQTPYNDVELLKKEKAELEREIFTVRAQLEDMTDKFLSTSRSNAETRQEYEGIARQFEERLRLFRDLQLTNESLLTQKGLVDQECVSVKRERDEKELLLKRVNKEKQLIAVEIQSLKEQLKDLSTQKKELEIQRRTMEKFQQDARMECQRAMDEKAVYEESKRWFMNELADRDTQIASIRLGHSGKEVSWQNERMRLVEEKTSAVNEVEDIKMDLVLKQRLLDEANDKLKVIGEANDAQLTTLKDEIASRECLIRTLKEQMNRADEASNELKSLYDSTSNLLQNANEEIERARLDTASQIENCNMMVAERDRIVAELKDELEKANELIKNKHNLTLSDEAIEEMSPTAAVASRLLKSGGSLTAIYREHAKLAAQLEDERARSRLTEESFQEVISQLTERAPQLIHQKEQLEKYTDECYRLGNQLRDADEQRKELIEQRDYANRELAFTKGELEKYQRDSDILTDRISSLVFALEKERRGSDRRTPDADDENQEDDDRMFRDIKSLTRRNQELESELRMEKARTHQLAREEVEEATQRLTRDRNDMQRDLEMHKTQCIKLETALEGRQHALDSYKNIVEGGGLGGENVIVKRQLEQKIAELNDAQQKIIRIEEWRASEKEDKEKMMNMYEDRIKQHMAIVSETKRGNGKMESDLELHKQTALETYKEVEKLTRKWERAIEAEQKAREMVVATEQKMAGLHEKLMEMQGQISALRVERRSLDEQLKMSMSNEMRLKAELDSRAQNNYHNDMMINMMAEMESRMNAVESSKKEVMEMRVESLENERDQLKTSNAALVERNERLERERGAEVTKLQSEKTSLESQFLTERNERIAAESETNELRAKLVATQKHFTAVDESIGSNPERLAQECQKLKNDNKFLEGQMEELKKRAEMADCSAKRSEEELNRLTSLSSTVESTLIDTTRAGTLEQERLKGLLEAEQIKANNLWNEVNRLKDDYNTLLNSSNEMKNADNSNILELQQKISVLEMNLREESAKGVGFDDRMKGVNDEKAIVMSQLNGVNEQLMGVKGELEEIRLEKEAASEKVRELEAHIASMEGQFQEESNRWMDEKMRMEGEYKRLEMENEGQTARYEEEVKRKEEQINQMMSMAREVDGSSMEVEGVNQMSAVNRYLREEQQRATERMMRAEVERKRVKVQNDELEGERMRLERVIKDLEAKSEADSTALADMANLRLKLERSMNTEKELVGMKEEREKLTKISGELQRKLNMIVTEKNKLMEEAKNLKESIGTLTNDNGVKMRETTGLKKTIQDKENELNRLRSELAKKVAEPAPMGGGRMAQQLKMQLEASQKELAETRDKGNKELEAANAKVANLRRLALKYKSEAETSSSSSGVVTETGEATEGMLNTPPSSIAFKRLQEEKDKLDEKLKEITAEKNAIEGERDEIRFRQSSMNSMLDKAKRQKDLLADENTELKRRLTELGVVIETSAPPPLSQSVSPNKPITSPTKTIPSISNASVSQSTSNIAIDAPTTSSVIVSSSPIKPVVSMGEKEDIGERIDESIDVSTVSTVSPVSTVTASAPSDPAPPPTTSTNIFGSGNIDWPDKISRIGSTSSSSTPSSLGGHPSLFGRSAPTSSIPSIPSIPSTRIIPDVSTSTAIPDVPSFSTEWKVEDEQPISSSSSGDTTRKRGASDDRMEMKRARVEEEDDDDDEGANDVITSSHRGNDIEDVMVEDDTRDGEVEEEGERKEEEHIPIEVPIEEEASRDSVIAEDDEEEEDGDDDIEVVGDDENDDEDDSQRDDEMEDPDIDDGREIRREMAEVIDVDDDDDDDDNEEEEVEVEEGAERDVPSDDEDEEEDEDDEDEDDDDDEDEDDDDDEGQDEMDRGSESDGEVEGEDGDNDNDVVDGEERDEGREAIASMDEADEEGAMSGENPSAKSESSEGEKKKRSPIVWKGEEQEECSSSNESGRPSTSSVSTVPLRGGVVRGRGANPPRVPRAPTDLATNLMRFNRGGRGGASGGTQRGKRGGQGN